MKITYHEDSGQIEGIDGSSVGGIIGQTEEHLAIYSAGRSVYQSSIGTTYHPARIIFAQILDKIGPIFHLELLMNVPVRRR